jgi:hypothetical protein
MGKIFLARQQIQLDFCVVAIFTGQSIGQDNFNLERTMNKMILSFALFCLSAVFLSRPFANLGSTLTAPGPTPYNTSGDGEVVQDSGCVRSGVEAGCLILKTFDDKKIYNLFFPDGKAPEIGAAISFEGVKHDGPTTCMQGTAVNVKKWTRLKRRCPPEHPQK